MRLFKPINLLCLATTAVVLASPVQGRRALHGGMTATAIATPTQIVTATTPAASVVRAVSPGISISISANQNIGSFLSPPPAAPVMQHHTLPPITPCSLPPTPQPAAPPAWQFGVCPLVIRDADFVGFDVAEAPEPDVATCCEQCEKSLIAWKEANPLPNAIPTLQDNVCIAWTYTIDKVCYLKNGVQNGARLTITPIPGSFTGSFAGNITSLQPMYDDLVQTYLSPITVRSAAAAVAAPPVNSLAIVNNTCADPHCQQILATLNTTVTAHLAPADPTG